MFFQFTVSGPNIRVFLSALICVSRLGDAVNIVGLSDGIEISAVSPHHSGHIAVWMHEHCFDRFLLEIPSRQSGLDNGSRLVSSDAAANNGWDGTNDDRPKPHLRLLTKTLGATVLRQHNNTSVQSIDFQYRSAASSDTASVAGGDASTERAHTDDDMWKGRAETDLVRVHCTYGPNLTKTFLLRLAEGEPTSIDVNLSLYRFEVCGEARAYGSLLASLPSSANLCALTLPKSGGLELRSVRQAAAAASDRESGSAAASPGDLRATDGSSTVVTAFKHTFTLFRFFEPAAPAAVTDGVGAATEMEFEPSELPPTALSTSQQQQQDPRRNSLHAAPGCAATTTVTVDFVSLPSKTFEVKPFKNATWLAEQLGVQLKLFTGESGVPIIIASITPEEVEQHHPSIHVDAARRKNRSGGAFSTAARPSLVTSGAPSVPVPGLVSFILHVAALDSPHDSGRASGSSDAVGGVADTSIATAISSAVNSPRHSSHYRSSKGAGGAQTEAPATPTPGYGEGEGDALPPVGTGNSTTSGTPSHVEASFVSASAAASALGQASRLSRESNSVADFAYATPRSTASPSEVIMVMTGGDTPGIRSTDTDAVRTSSGFPTGVTATPLLAPTSHTITTTNTALNSMYPLDFEAFVRTYTSANEVDDEAEEEYAQDAELREFLASCVASMSRGPTQN
ncbi:hypothetical protein JKF63_06137 [Porcisia hertigi]|uniref:Uncharacterized protein n=1 Tax=Porcisia hertigi TaxID=2761500 RepID=A0A836IZ61_9TRYP|nr:hypothetical protein JKF63_06137 [Porcisia hertigi]